MITADEARKMSADAEEAILNQPRFATLFAELEKMIRRATERGDRTITWTDHTDKQLHVSFNGDSAFKRKLSQLGYNFSYTDHGHYELSW